MATPHWQRNGVRTVARRRGCDAGSHFPWTSGAGHIHRLEDRFTQEPVLAVAVDSNSLNYGLWLRLLPLGEEVVEDVVEVIHGDIPAEAWAVVWAVCPPDLHEADNKAVELFSRVGRSDSVHAVICAKPARNGACMVMYSISDKGISVPGLSLRKNSIRNMWVPKTAS